MGCLGRTQWIWVSSAGIMAVFRSELEALYENETGRVGEWQVSFSYLGHHIG